MPELPLSPSQRSMNSATDRVFELVTKCRLFIETPAFTTLIPEGGRGGTEKHCLSQSWIVLEGPSLSRSRSRGRRRRSRQGEVGDCRLDRLDRSRRQVGIFGRCGGSRSRHAEGGRGYRSAVGLRSRSRRAKSRRRRSWSRHAIRWRSRSRLWRVGRPRRRWRWGWGWAGGGH
jgi:hypothetical protein